MLRGTVYVTTVEENQETTRRFVESYPVTTRLEFQHAAGKRFVGALEFGPISAPWPIR